jgi:hypothetical protein
MSEESNIEIFPGEHRTHERDWLVDTHGRRRGADIVSFTPGLLQCSICGGRTHRANSCSKRPREKKR